MNYMKTLTQHITERLHLNKDRIRKYEYQPKTTQELISVINEITHEQRNEKIINLNVIDTSKITDMSGVFKYRKNIYDISQWDVSGVTDMTSMFESSEFNGDISQWDVSHVKDMSYMFSESQFNGNISQWDVSNENLIKIYQNGMYRMLEVWKTCFLVQLSIKTLVIGMCIKL